MLNETFSVIFKHRAKVTRNEIQVSFEKKVGAQNYVHKNLVSSQLFTFTKVLTVFILENIEIICENPCKFVLKCTRLQSHGRFYAFFP